MSTQATELFPILTTPDVERSLAFYRDLLGAEVEYQFPPEGTPGYVGLTIGASHLGIGLGEQGEQQSGGLRPITLWVYVDDCDATVTLLRDAGTVVVEEPADQPWGERIARVTDPDGNEVIVGSRSTQ